MRRERKEKKVKAIQEDEKNIEGIIPSGRRPRFS